MFDKALSIFLEIGQHNWPRQNPHTFVFLCQISAVNLHSVPKPSIIIEVLRQHIAQVKWLIHCYLMCQKKVKLGMYSSQSHQHYFCSELKCIVSGSFKRCLTVLLTCSWNKNGLLQKKPATSFRGMHSMVLSTSTRGAAWHLTSSDFDPIAINNTDHVKCYESLVC